LPPRPATGSRSRRRALDLYVRHLPTGEHRVIDRVPGNTIEVSATLEELLAVALAAHL